MRRDENIVCVRVDELPYRSRLLSIPPVRDLSTETRLGVAIPRVSVCRKPARRERFRAQTEAKSWEEKVNAWDRD